MVQLTERKVSLVYSAWNLVLNCVTIYFLVLLYFELKRLERRFEVLLERPNIWNKVQL